ncbi:MULTISPECIES: iron-sulfur cluster assembly scaffold protein [Arcobacteraceae]|uniref:iron-sulfur cluster assembly scaffold protein n=1 Tax=Arcobacteraceae TaxID=2808963 RepID=UPI000DE9BC6D|nr:iron-sulfur cluster assembly scaffold protein [Arcobacter sp. CECT 9188]RBQ27710.1 iron-sulfur cluster assembly scaffold protein NifU [Arcobacter sp. CECT 9188]
MKENSQNEYSNKILERIDEPKNLGVITKEKAKEFNLKLLIADYESNAGDSIRLYWVVDKQSNIIMDAKFQSFGSGIIIALNDMMTELCIGKTVEKASKITKTDVEFALRDRPEIPAMNIQELYDKTLNFVVIKKIALSNEEIDVSSFDDDYLVCECARVNLGDIKSAIKQFDLTTIEDIGQITKAGIFCKSCQEEGGLEEKEIYLSDILEYTRKEIDEQKQKNQERSQIDFESLSKEEKLKLIDEVLDEDVRPMLVMDGGNMEILDLVDSKPHYDLYIRYLGACSGCSSGSMGTLYAIESILQDKVFIDLRVLPI